MSDSGAGNLDFRYGLGVGFDGKAIRSPFVAGKRMPAVNAIGRPLPFGRKDFSDDRLTRQATSRLARRFSGRDRLADWIRRQQPGGLVISVPEGSAGRQSAKLDIQVSGQTLQRLLLVVAAGQKLELTVRQRGSGRSTALFEILAGEGSQVRVNRVQDMAGGYDYLRLQAELSAAADLTVSECLFGGDYTASWSEVDLAGAGAGFRSRSVVIARAEEKFDLFRVAKHLSPDTHSELDSVNVLLDRARQVDRGLIAVAPGRGGCTAEQRAKTLLLSAQADYVSQPKLEVAEDEVRCSHACSVGTVNPEKLFYLMARGLTREAAERWLVQGFIDPVLAEMGRVGLEEMVLCLVAKRFQEHSSSG